MQKLVVDTALLDFLLRFNIHACVRFPTEEEAKNPSVGNVELEYGLRAYVITDKVHQNHSVLNDIKISQKTGVTITDTCARNLDNVFNVLKRTFPEYKIKVSPRQDVFRITMSIDDNDCVPVSFLGDILGMGGVRRVVAGGPLRCVDIHVYRENLAVEKQQEDHLKRQREIIRRTYTSAGFTNLVRRKRERRREHQKQAAVRHGADARTATLVFSEALQTLTEDIEAEEGCEDRDLHRVHFES